MNRIHLSIEVKHHIKICIDNLKFLMNSILEIVPKDHFDRINRAFKLKLNGCLRIILNWYRSYIQSIPDGLLMILEQEMKLKRLNNHENTRIQKLNYNIQEEIYNFMTRVYNLYPNR